MMRVDVVADGRTQRLHHAPVLVPTLAETDEASFTSFTTSCTESTPVVYPVRSHIALELQQDDALQKAIMDHMEVILNAVDANTLATISDATNTTDHNGASLDKTKFEAALLAFKKQAGRDSGEIIFVGSYLYERAMAMLAESRDPDHAELALLRSNFAEMLVKLDDRARELDWRRAGVFVAAARSSGFVVAADGLCLLAGEEMLRICGITISGPAGSRGVGAAGCPRSGVVLGQQPLMRAGLTRRRRDVSARQPAVGRTRVLAVGIDDYDRDCGFEPLSTRRNDALELANCFRDIPQLAAEPGAVKALVSGQGKMPSRGEIIKALRELGKSSGADDRLIFYFSGYVHRLADESYLVPQDAFADDDPGCLIALSFVEEILGGSQAGQKIVIVDACSAGAADVEAVAEGLRDSARIAVLASVGDARSTTRSPNPQHSSFTALLLPALRGAEPEALDERRLTVASLGEFLSARMSRRAVLANGADGGVLADFSGPLLGAEGLGIDGKLFAGVELSGGPRAVPVKEILKDLSRTHYSQSYLEQRANAALGEYLEEEFGRVVSRLRAQFRWASSAVIADGASVTFPDGSYGVRYEATEKTRGVLLDELALQPAWLDAPELMAALLECLQFAPERIRFALSESCVLARCVPKLEASGWRITSELPYKIEAVHGDCTLILEEQALTLLDLPLREMFAATPDRDAVRKAAAALAVFSGG